MGEDNASQLIRGPLSLASNQIQSKWPHVVLAPQLKRNRMQPEPIIQMVKDIQTEYTIDPKETYISGFSMGSFLTWRILSQFDGFFKKAVPISGDACGQCG